MDKQNFNDLFLDELRDMYSSEKQIVKALPKLIDLASSTDLKEALSSHLQETKNQIRRIEDIFSILGLEAKEEFCDGMQGILKEVDQMVSNQPKSAVLDAAIISGAQKVEHYEIASYGTLHSFAKTLKLDSKVAEHLQETLDEEGSANKTLTKMAEGTLFSSGINQEAATCCSKG